MPHAQRLRSKVCISSCEPVCLVLIGARSCTRKPALTGCTHVCVHKMVRLLPAGVFFTTQSSGTLSAWDLVYKHCEPTLQVQVSDQPLTAFAIQDGGAVLGCGTADGCCSIMQLSSALVDMVPNEKQTVSAMLEREILRWVGGNWVRPALGQAGDRNALSGRLTTSLWTAFSLPNTGLLLLSLLSASAAGTAAQCAQRARYI